MKDLKIFTDNIEEKAKGQIDLLLEQEAFKDCKIRIMPDVHAGAGCVIGFAGDLGDAFEKNYSEQIFFFYDKGIVDSDDFSNFQGTINKFFVQYRKQTFDLYQKLILTEAIYLGAPHDYCAKLIHLVSEGKSVISELAKLMKEYPVISTAIQKVNFDQKPVWDIFGVPIYDFTKDKT